MQQFALQKAMEKGGLRAEDLDYVLAGDLLNQCIGTSFGLRDFKIPFYGLYGAFIVGAIMCLINPAIGALNTMLANFLSSMGSVSKLLLSVVLAAMMATDMGGPFNKAGYRFRHPRHFSHCAGFGHVQRHGPAYRK